MNKLGARNFTLIAQAAKTVGTFNPDEILPFFEEELYVAEFDEVEGFLTWLHENGKTMGHGNYEEVFQEFKEAAEDEAEKYFCPVCRTRSANFESCDNKNCNER